MGVGCQLSGGTRWLPATPGSWSSKDLTQPVRFAAGVGFVVWYGGEVGHGVIAEPLFERSLDPTPDEIRRWASSDCLVPDPDWDLCIWSDDAFLPTFVQLATDRRIRHPDFFLRLLYGRVGDAVRSGQVSSRTTELITELVGSQHQQLRRFAQRAASLVARPELFEYDDWCMGVLSRDPNPWPPA